MSTPLGARQNHAGLRRERRCILDARRKPCEQGVHNRGFVPGLDQHGKIRVGGIARLASAL
ncbi:glycoside hydrolase family 3 domain protein [Mizugakiibacter sediminis]|uniref:Glycoside hydrolase family 3 domain protein n=1 Tax=Mizugakiibacter sediminis TaxID=1475481 RepID=A0A0K8QNP7_9GAMM|nr:hypothetical protein [Mizugakiibacter sediminis]GAP66042.1 glycoside hydrolase family 3 domain protein [Mizugakiibacter sediminis]